MAIYKCKMCGGDIHPQTGTRLITCEYCGTTQTVCNIDDSRIATLFNRANEQRLQNEFDKAESLYEIIIIENPEEAEAYWGKLLCKFGIEYVDDALTGKKIPTCHRTIYESIFDDPDYQRVIKNSDNVSRDKYREEAAAIDLLQKNILHIASQEDPYDIFICYKETDELGDRTKDSLYAEQLYDALTAKGYRVFFSRISLEGKLGKEYEPIIFSAINSSKIMLVVGTQKDYLESAWVKNEWKRYIELSKKDRQSKTLIPCYANIEPYDLPKEFVALQSQDLNKIGAIQDIIRGIEKLIEKTTAVNTNQQALDTLMLERNQREKRKKKIKRIIVPIIFILFFVVIGVVIWKQVHKPVMNTESNDNVIEPKDNTERNFKVKIVEDLSEGIPSADLYDVLIVKASKDNKDELLFVDYMDNHLGDKHEKVIFNKLHDDGWFYANEWLTYLHDREDKNSFNIDNPVKVKKIKQNGINVYLLSDSDSDSDSEIVEGEIGYEDLSRFAWIDVYYMVGGSNNSFNIWNNGDGSFSATAKRINQSYEKIDNINGNLVYFSYRHVKQYEYTDNSQFCIKYLLDFFDEDIATKYDFWIYDW